MMPDRSDLIQSFLVTAGWGDAARRTLAGDASSRRYERLRRGGQTAVLMDAPADTGASIARFLQVADWLLAHGYSAPRTLFAAPDDGLLLLEDLGDALFARLIAAEPASEIRLYSAAIDFLGDLRDHPAPDFVAPLDAAALADLTRLTPAWYLRGIGAPITAAAQALPDKIATTYARLVDTPPILSLRDFHAENLILLPGRPAPANVGLLDFQDAVAAHPAYDLVSLLQDARRSVGTATESAMVARYVAQNRLDAARFSAIYALLGAQRQIRILGVFARLCLHFAKPQYLAHMPRVWDYLLRNLSHPELGPLRDITLAALPAPTPGAIRHLKEGCGCIPNP